MEMQVRLSAPLRGVTLSPPAAAAGVAAAPKPARTLAPLEQQPIEQALSNLVKAERDLRKQYESALADMEQATITLALACASRIVHEKLSAGAFAIDSIVRHVIERLAAKHPATVYLHPDDLASLQARLGDGRAAALTGADLRLVADASLGRGDCRAEAGELTVLSQVEAQLADLRDLLFRSAAHADGARG